MKGGVSAVRGPGHALRGPGRPAYSRTMRALHWYTAALLLGPYLTILAIDHVAGEADAVWLAMLHRSFGLVILAVTVARLAVRQRSAVPALPPGIPAAQRLAAKLTVAGLYALLIVQPLLGLLGTMLHGDRATVFGPLLLPLVLPVNRSLGRALFLLHGWAGLALLGLVALHALAALHHHVVRRDTVLVGMLPVAARILSTSRRPVTEGAPIRKGLS